MKNRIFGVSHLRVNPRDLPFILADTPKCTGRTDYLLCVYAKNECNRTCYASESLGCSRYNLLRQLKPYEDKFGVVKR